MTLKEAKQVAYGQTVYHLRAKNADGTPVRGRVCSIKRWKRTPDRIRVGLKIGWKDHMYLTNADLDFWLVREQDAYQEQMFHNVKGHLEIVPRYIFTTNQVKPTKHTRNIEYRFKVLLILCLENCNKCNAVHEKEILVPSDEFRADSFLGNMPMIRAAMARMKRHAHKIFDKQNWGDLYSDDTGEVIGIRSL